ncbi:urease accessory protein UreD [Gelidibacter salicanalis]|uniref:Urease accessory protein UreD n=1 Tax=Gelidibacter salicanalis TaxID=291193 RepID=A0A934KW82_9FLAO|nr:urease accessory protein UreD [Gelidibacter salicanalis]MBJ7882003.1 urease accessory protein UreD [Gelidibacter salicanalis]
MKNICELKITTGIVDGFHRLMEPYFTVPFGLLRFDARTPHDPWLRYMIRSSSPGILAGDFYDMEFYVEKDTALGLETQAYQRIYEMDEGGKAKQSMKVTVEENGFLHFIPHPLVPHKNSDYSAKNTIHLKKSSQLIWGEIITCGRKGSGEIFDYKRLMNHTEIFVDDQLIFKDKVLFEPKKIDVLGMGQLEGYTHQATLFSYTNKIESEELYYYLLERLKGEENIEFGLSTTLGDGVIIRIVGNSGEQLFHILKSIEERILDTVIAELV